MAAIDLSGKKRTDGVDYANHRTVTVDLTGNGSNIGANTDTITMSKLGLNELTEVWQKVTMGGTTHAPALTGALVDGGIYRFVGY